MEITTSPAEGTLTDNSVAVAAGQFVAVSDITAGILKFTPATGASGSPYTSFTFQVEDDGGTANGGMNVDPMPKTMAIDVVAPPQVTDILVGSTSWTPAFLASLQTAGLGDGAGYAIPVGSAAQLAPLAWINLNQIQIIFSENVKVKQDSLALSGVGGSYAFSQFNYNPATFTATWTLTASVSPDRLAMDVHAGGPAAVTDRHGYALDGEWTNGASSFPSGNGSPGGDFLFGFNDLPGDANSDGIVNGLDIASIASNWLLTGSIGGDINGDDVINGLDIAAIASNWLQGLPAASASTSGTWASNQNAAAISRALTSGATFDDLDAIHPVTAALHHDEEVTRSVSLAALDMHRHPVAESRWPLQGVIDESGSDVSLRVEFSDAATVGGQIVRPFYRQ